ncbi:unnamed protein product [Rhizophagus irregularis]|nr:unnamed protein product [Rhizophagus irregularis]
MENQESSVNMEAITADDIYEVQPRRNKLTLHILKHLPGDILHEELDISSIKSNEAIPDYGPCMECDISILTEDPLRLLVLNVCGDIIHRTCAKKIHKDGTLFCSCEKADNSDPLLPFQYSIVDYDGREKSSLINLKNLGYNILKSLNDETVGDIDFPELGSCSECGNDILISPLKRMFSPDCRKNVDILDQANALGIISNLPIPDSRKTSQSSGISPLSNLMETFALFSPPVWMGGIKDTATQQIISTLRCAKCSEDLSVIPKITMQ